MNRSKLESIITDAFIKLGEAADATTVNHNDEIRGYAENGCNYIADDELKLILYATTAAYYNSLKTIECTVKNIIFDIYDELEKEH